MEVRPGYKKTAVGVIPEDWGTVTLERSCAPNGLVRGPFGGTLKKETFVEDGKKVYEQKNAIYRDASIGAYFIDDTKFKQLKRFSINPGDFIVSCSGTIGRIFKIPSDAKPGVINQALLKIRTDPEVVDPDYFFHYFDWEYFQQRIIDNTHGGAMQNLVGMSVFRTVELARPSLPEQRAIVKALGDVDALIDALTRLIAKKSDLKQAAMQQLLTGQTRLPGFSGEWKIKRFVDLLIYERPDRYIVKSTDYSPNGDIPVLTANKSFILGFTAEFFNIFTDLPAIIFDDFTTDSKYIDFPFKVKSSAIKILKKKINEVDIRFIFKRMQIIQYPIGEHKRHYISEYQNIELPFPEYNEQVAIIAVLSDMDTEITMLEQRRAKTRALKQGMMQELLTGKTRLV